MNEYQSIDLHTPGAIPADQPGPSDGFGRLADLQSNGRYRLMLRVTGATCAHCIQKIESGVCSLEGVRDARLNFSTQRLSVTWDGDAALANRIAEKVEALGYGVEALDSEADPAGDEVKFLVSCLGVAGFALGNIMLISVSVWAGLVSDMGDATRVFMHWLTGLIGVPTVLYSGRPFFRSALKAVRAGGANMDVPISLALILAVGMSTFELLNHGDYVYFDSAVMLIFFLLIGRVLDVKARASARQSAEDLMQGLKGFAQQKTATGLVRIPQRDIRPGMILSVTKGDKIPADGIVKLGSSLINTALVTGEAMPQALKPGDRVFAGTFNLDSPLEIEAATSSSDSLLSEIVRLIEAAEQRRSRYVRLADRAAQLYTPVVHTLALAAFLLWWLVLGAAWQTALLTSITVLIITCPCALGLAVPVVQVLATSRLMKAGVMVKSGDALERLALVDTLVLDKTGTLTEGNPQMSSSLTASELALAAALAENSRHPLSAAIAAMKTPARPVLSSVSEIEGHGISARWNDTDVRLGRRSFVNVPDDEGGWDGLECWLKVGAAPAKQIRFEDPLRDDTGKVLFAFKDAEIPSMLLSGDRPPAVERVAVRLGIDQWHASLTPADKAEILEAVKAEGHRPLMIGDGLNDTPVLAAADVSMAPGSAIDMAQASADIVFPAQRFGVVAGVWKLAKRVRLLIQQNFMLAAAYNMIAIPLAFMGYVTPLVAAIAMSLSSLIVIANSYRLGRLQE